LKNVQSCIYRCAFLLTAAAGFGALAGCSGGSTTATAPVVTPGTLALASSTATLAQSAASVSVAINRTGGSSGNVSVNYATADGTALAGTDYTKTTGALVWNDGDASSRTISIPLLSTAAFGGTRTFTIGLSGALNGATIGTATETVSITGNLLPPSTNFSFTLPTGSWKLQLPIDQFGGTGGTGNIQYASIEETTAQLSAGFVDPYFYADTATYAGTTNHVVFVAPSNGAVTTPGTGSDHTRSELRELYTGTGADASSDWNSAIGGTLTANCVVQAVSASSDEATIGQIHNQSYVFMLLLYRPTQKDIAVDIYSSLGSSTHTRASLVQNVKIGDPIAYSIAYKNTSMTVTVNGTTQTYTIDPTWAGTPMYFKLGAYHAAPNIGNPAGDKTQVAFSSFAITH
jgi:hypothetical protein